MFNTSIFFFWCGCGDNTSESQKHGQLYMFPYL